LRADAFIKVRLCVPGRNSKRRAPGVDRQPICFVGLLVGFVGAMGADGRKRLTQAQKAAKRAEAVAEAAAERERHAKVLGEQRRAEGLAAAAEASVGGKKLSAKERRAEKKAKKARSAFDAPATAAAAPAAEPATKPVAPRPLPPRAAAPAAPPPPPPDRLDALLAACNVDAAAVRAWLDAEEIDLETLAKTIKPEYMEDCPGLSRDQAVALVAAARRGAVSCPGDAGAARTSSGDDTDGAEPRPPGDAADDASDAGGVVTLTHSTFVPGLKPAMERLARRAGVVRVTPGELREGSGHAETFRLEFQRELENGSFKLVARKGKTAQDVFVVAKRSLFSAESLRDALLNLNERDSRRGGGGDAAVDFGDGPLNLSGREAAAIVTKRRHAAAQRERERTAKAEKDRKHDKAVKEKTRRLRATAAAREGSWDLKEGAESWVNAERQRGGKHAMGGHVRRSVRSP
jgi:hypothetical protein